MSQSILVTGDIGCIGTHNVLQLLLGGSKTVIVDNLNNASEIAIERVRELAWEHNDNLTFHQGSVGHGPSTGLLGTTMSSLKNLLQTGSSTLLNLPERPDQPECQYYMKTGSCKYGTTCKYHHPKERNSAATYTLGPHGFPLRPGQAVCTFYSMYASCKYGSECRFDHPLVRYYNYSLPMLSTPDPLSLIVNQRNSHARWTSAESSPSKTQRYHVLLGKSDEPQSSGKKDHANPAQTISPSYTAPSPDHSD